MRVSGATIASRIHLPPLMAVTASRRRRSSAPGSPWCSSCIRARPTLYPGSTGWQGSCSTRVPDGPVGRFRRAPVRGCTSCPGRGEMVPVVRSCGPVRWAGGSPRDRPRRRPTIVPDDPGPPRRRYPSDETRLRLPLRRPGSGRIPARVPAWAQGRDHRYSLADPAAARRDVPWPAVCPDARGPHLRPFR